MSGPAPAAGGRIPRRPQLSDDVADHVRLRIMSGALRPGTFIRLDETAAGLGVSVTPVREALSKLRGEGLVESVPHRGYVVGELTRGDIADIFWLQGRIAVELAARAAGRATAEDLDELSGLCDALEEALGGAGGSAADADADAIALCEFEFHRRLNVIAGSAKLAWFLHGAARYTPHGLYAADPDWGVFAVACHRRLIAALRAGDVDDVRAQTAAQFTDGARRLIAHLEAAGMWDAPGEPGPVSGTHGARGSETGDAAGDGAEAGR